MKIIVSLLLIALLIGSNGCMTYSAVEEAKGHQEQSRFLWEDRVSDNKSHPAYYASLPLTVPLDIATSPIQAIVFGIGYWMVRTDGGRQPWSPPKSP